MSSDRGVKRCAAALCFVLLSVAGACSGGSPQAGGGEPGHVSPNVLAAQSKHPSDDPCFRRVGDVWHHVGERNCVELLPRQRMRGVWVYDFEESSFIPNAASIPRADNRIRFRVNLDVVPEDIARVARTPLSRRDAQAFEIDFLGRRSNSIEPYGDYVVVVDRIISARYLGPAPVPDFARNNVRDTDLNQPLPANLWDANAPQPN